MKLYKYLPPNRIDVLKELLIRFSQPTSFNDPFECKPRISNDLSKEQWLKIGERNLDELRVPEADRHAYRKMYEEDHHLELWPQTVKFIQELFASMTVALCLTEKCDDLLMWAHYASSHEGFVIGFDVDHPFVKGPGNGIYALTRIVYTPTRPRATISTLSLIEAYFTKSRAWEYEQEWRVFANINDATQVLEGGPYPMCLFKIPPESLTEVIVGARASNEFAEQISAIVHSTPAMKHIQLRRCSINESEFKLDIGDMDQ